MDKDTHLALLHKKVYLDKGMQSNGFQVLVPRNSQAVVAVVVAAGWKNQIYSLKPPRKLLGERKSAYRVWIVMENGELCRLKRVGPDICSMGRLKDDLNESRCNFQCLALPSTSAITKSWSCVQTAQRVWLYVQEIAANFLFLKHQWSPPNSEFRLYDQTMLSFEVNTIGVTSEFANVELFPRFDRVGCTNCSAPVHSVMLGL